jgi:hypothetical protein
MLAVICAIACFVRCEEKAPASKAAATQAWLMRLCQQ